MCYLFERSSVTVTALLRSTLEFFRTSSRSFKRWLHPSCLCERKEQRISWLVWMQHSGAEGILGEVVSPIQVSYLSKIARIAISRKRHFRSPKRKNENTIQSTPQNLGKLTSETHFGHSKMVFRPLLRTKIFFSHSDPNEIFKLLHILNRLVETLLER